MPTPACPPGRRAPLPLHPGSVCDPKAYASAGPTGHPQSDKGAITAADYRTHGRSEHQAVNKPVQTADSATYLSAHTGAHATRPATSNQASYSCADEAAVVQALPSSPLALCSFRSDRHPAPHYHTFGAADTQPDASSEPSRDTHPNRPSNATALYTAQPSPNVTTSAKYCVIPSSPISSLVSIPYHGTYHATYLPAPITSW